MYVDVSEVKYPDLDSIIRLYPNPEIVLGKEIVWQEKRDGSNLGVRLNESGELEVRSRNMANASKSFFNAFVGTDEAAKIKELLLSLRDEWNTTCVIFGEMLMKGSSPTRVELHESNDFMLFDIWSSKEDGLIPYTLVHQWSYHFDISMVELYGTSKHTTIESLLSFRDDMLVVAKENGREGVVGKTFNKNVRYEYFKEKLDTPKLEKKPRHIEDGAIVLPTLPESEALGALNKVLVDLGYEDIKKVKLAMPLFARYVNDECKKHNCSKPEMDLYRYYTMFLEEHR